MRTDGHWVGTWATAPPPAEGIAFANHTLRMMARVSLGGDTLRLRLSNAHSERNLVIGAAHLALRDPEHPTRMPPVYDCGGYLQMGESIDLSLFD